MVLRSSPFMGDPGEDLRVRVHCSGSAVFFDKDVCRLQRPQFVCVCVRTFTNTT